MDYDPLTRWFQVSLIPESGIDQIPHARPETPRNVTHTHDDDCSDEDSDYVKRPEVWNHVLRETEICYLCLNMAI